MKRQTHSFRETILSQAIWKVTKRDLLRRSQREESSRTRIYAGMWDFDARASRSAVSERASRTRRRISCGMTPSKSCMKRSTYWRLWRSSESINLRATSSWNQDSVISWTCSWLTSSMESRKFRRSLKMMWTCRRREYQEQRVWTSGVKAKRHRIPAM